MSTATREDRASITAPTWIRDHEVEENGARPRQGIRLKDLPFFDAERGIMLRAAIAVTAADAHSPRHRHTFDQVRYFIDGRTTFGSDVVGPGDCMYFPEGAHYGPQVAHEGEDCLHVAIQFGGPSGIPYPNPADQRRAVEELKAAGGTFEKGIYHAPDGHRQDGFDAVLEHLTGRSVEYPRPRIPVPVTMRGAAYAWRPLDGRPGVEVKDLGYFNECGPNIKLLRLAAGASTPPRSCPWQELRFVVHGSVEYAGERYDTVSCGYLPADVAHEATTGAGAEGGVLLVVQLSAPGGPAPAFDTL
jgi:hypothetical protein